MMQKIKGVVKNYDWGGFDFIPDLLNVNKTGDPFGEYWLGTHPDGMATVIDTEKPLTQILGKDLPFLLKILDVRNMLSIQVHPDKSTAESGYWVEEQEGKPRDAKDRVYKDQNHKPELMVALSDFWLVQGFKPVGEILKTLEANPELKIITDYLSEKGLEKTYEFLMTMPQEQVNHILKPLGQRIKPLYENGELNKNDINFWAARAYFTYNRKGFCDRGIFSLYFMNLVNLKPGEGIYQAPGVLHAYMEGQNIECMATSDNVIRGGLTSKHIDIDQLLKVVKFESVQPEIIQPVNGVYLTPASEFQLSRLTTSGSIKIETPAVLLNMGDSCTLELEGAHMVLNTGEAAIVNAEIRIPDLTDRLYLATSG